VERRARAGGNAIQRYGAVCGKATRTVLCGGRAAVDEIPAFRAMMRAASARAAARSIGHDILVMNAGSEHDLDTAFATLRQQQVGAVLVANDAFFVTHRKQLVVLAARHSIPAIHFLREFVDEGGLMSYGNSLADAYRQVGIPALACGAGGKSSRSLAFNQRSGRIGNIRQGPSLVYGVRRTF
jgi:hypothetical protein